jgi:hypothetical protein
VYQSSHGIENDGPDAWSQVDVSQDSLPVVAAGHCNSGLAAFCKRGLGAGAALAEASG